MRNSTFWLTYLLLVAVQLVLTHYFRVSPYITLCILPSMVLCISIRTGTIPTLLIAFATGLVTDLLSEGVMGLNTLALLPVALLRNNIIRLVLGTEVFARQEDFSVRRNSMAQLLLTCLIGEALFLLLYVWVDGAGMRPFGFNLLRWGCSLGCSMILSLFVLELLAPDPRR